MKTFIFLAIAFSVCFLCQVRCAAITGIKGEAFVLSAEDEAFLFSSDSDEVLKRNKRNVEKASIKSLHVTSVVVSRFARVTIVNEMVNSGNDSKDMTFSVRLPEAAFITEFQMEVNGVTFVGKVKEKETAKKQFQKAQQSGNTAGLITADVRETQTFNVRANVAARSSATFTLVYQELLKRRLGEYNHVILVNPGQIVQDLMIEVYITESPGITSLNLQLPNSEKDALRKSGGYGEIPIEYDIRRSKHQAKITFKPTENQQKQLMLIPKDERKLTVRYDVTREELGGEIQTRNGYFVHFFAPENLPIFPKNVVFVIDRSGSMWGTKMKQTKKAFESILNEMRDSDQFSIISFAGDVTVWNSSQTLVKVDKESVKDAIKYVNRTVPDGLTNINDAMTRAAELLAKDKSDKHKSSMIILLTDGDPTTGVTNTARIRMNVKNAVGGRFSVFCLGFGNNLNHKFLKRMANENDGISRQIYEDSDADLQLEGFFQEVASPLLLHFEIKYRGAEVQKITKSKFDKYFSGSEVIVVGQVTSNEMPLRAIIEGDSMSGKVHMRTESFPQDDSNQHWFRDTGDFDDFIERLWAYFTIKELLHKNEVSDSIDERNEYNERILNLAIKYSFVTPLTSMVVTLPEDDIPTASPTGSTILPPPPPCFPRDADLPENLMYPPIWCPYVLSEDEISGTGGSDYLVGFHDPGISLSALAYPAQLMPMSSYHFQMAPPVMSSYLQPVVPAIANMPYTSTTTATTTTTTATTTTTTTTVTPQSCNKDMTESSGRIESLRDVATKTVCEWTIVLNEASWVNLHLEKTFTTLNRIEIFIGDNSVYSHSSGSLTERYFLLKSNTVKIRMEIYPSDNERNPMAVNYEEYIPGGPKMQTTEMSSQNLFSEDLAITSTIITSSVNKTGFISSPNYPESYPSNSHSLWTFVNTDPNLQLRLTFLDMDIEMNGDGSCTHDRIVVMDGDDERDLCGYDVSDLSRSTTAEIVKIAFVRDDKLETSGFKMKYTFVSMSS